MKSEVYKKRCIILAIFLIVSVLLAIPMKNSLITENNSIKDAIEFVELNDDNKVKEETSLTKEEALESLNKIKDYYSFVDEYSETVLYAGLVLGIFGLLSGFMLYFIGTDMVLKKFLPDLKRWMSVLIRIIVLIILIPFLYFIIAEIGMILALPNLIYQIYKYINVKKKENKDDVIE